MIRLRDVPGVAAIETRLTLNELTGVRTDHELSRMIEGVLWNAFGISGCPSLEFEWVHDEDESEEVSDAEYWARVGWDVTDADGAVLRCLEVLEDGLVCVAFGYAGRPTLEIEADLWRKEQAANSNIDPKRASRDQSYLSFGASPRRRA